MIKTDLQKALTVLKTIPATQLKENYCEAKSRNLIIYEDGTYQFIFGIPAIGVLIPSIYLYCKTSAIEYLEDEITNEEIYNNK
jgi:hypothetical protein